MTLHFATFYVSMPEDRDASVTDAHMSSSADASIKMINILMGSARAFNPGARFSILTTAPTDLSGVDIPFDRVDIPVDPRTLDYDRAIGQRQLAAELPVGDTLLLLDSDMIVQADLSHIATMKSDVALTWRPGDVPISGRFIALRNRKENGALRFFDDYLQIYRTLSPEERRNGGDQTALNRLLPTYPEWRTKMLAAPYNGATISFLPADEYDHSTDGDEATDPGALRRRRLLHFRRNRDGSMPAYAVEFKESHRSVLTPYLVPPEVAQYKVPNIGDGFILRAVERMFGKVAKNHVFSPRLRPAPANEAMMAAGDMVILAGANQLNDNYTIWPGLTADEIRSRGYRFLPVGVGLHGEAEMATAMSEKTAGILRAIHDRIEYSSWRCPMTVDYLEASLPDLKGRFLMTGCPVMFDKPLLVNRAFHEGEDHIAVTITERGANWFKRESATLQAIHARYPSARKSLVLHQDFMRLSDPTKPSPLDILRQAFHEQAINLGFEIHRPTASEAIGFYHTVDMHFGSRLHAHLLMLSRNRKSFVTIVDNRTLGLARAFRFPILRLRDLNLDETLAFDFEQMRDRVLRVHETMQKFVASAKALH